MNKFLLIISAVLSLVSCVTEGGSEDDVTSKLLETGTVAPDFTMHSDSYPDGITLSSFRGKYVLLEFWRANCPDCQAVSGTIKELYGRYGGGNIVFIGVSFDPDTDVWKNYIKENGLSWIQYHDENLDSAATLKNVYGIRWVPTFYLIDKEGHIVFGTIEAKNLEKELEKVKE